MTFLPDYIGPAAFGIKMGVILPNTDLMAEICQVASTCCQDGIIDDGDILCITESVVARAQNNFVTLDEIAQEVQKKLSLTAKGKVGIVFPILSRNRFAMILKAIARATRGGEVVVQLSYPFDEVGNALMPPDYCDALGEKENREEILWPQSFAHLNFTHPITGVDYIAFYRKFIEGEGAKATIYLSNNPRAIESFGVHGLIAADVHNRNKTKKALEGLAPKAVTLQELCNNQNTGCGKAWSEWGLLGSNMTAGEKLKLAPRRAGAVATEIQRCIKEQFNKHVEVIIYGDGAYRDPSSGIYELADPRPAFGSTPGVNCFREGLKYKFLADQFYDQGKSPQEIEALIKARTSEEFEKDRAEAQGTTPRRLEDILASLADLVSGSADAGTPLVVIKGFTRGTKQ